MDSRNSREAADSIATGGMQKAPEDGEDGLLEWVSASRRLIPAELDLASTLECGQAFRWKRLPANDEILSTIPAWRAVIRRKIVVVWQTVDRLHAAMRPGPFDPALLDRYFDLSRSLVSIRDEIDVDEHIRSALSRYPGLRVLQQDPWETLLSFILSQWSSVPRISGQIETLSRLYGSEIAPGIHAFPQPETLSETSVEELRQLGLGYRAKYVLAAARQSAALGADWLEPLRAMSYREACDYIVLTGSTDHLTQKIQGVGPKVADCVLLFGLGHYDAVPVDVHVRRAFERWYSDRSTFTSRYDSVSDFARSHFGRFAGYAQQYLFHRQRTGE